MRDFLWRVGGAPWALRSLKDSFLQKNSNTLRITWTLKKLRNFFHKITTVLPAILCKVAKVL
jgi:hypothetical protein